MLQAAGDFRLAHKAQPAVFMLREMDLHDLEGHVAAHFLVAGQVNFAQSAASMKADGKITQAIGDQWRRVFFRIRRRFQKPMHLLELGDFVGNGRPEFRTFPAQVIDGHIVSTREFLIPAHQQIVGTAVT